MALDVIVYRVGRAIVSTDLDKGELTFCLRRSRSDFLYLGVDSSSRTSAFQIPDSASVDDPCEVAADRSTPSLSFSGMCEGSIGAGKLFY